MRPSLSRSIHRSRGAGAAIVIGLLQCLLILSLAQAQPQPPAAQPAQAGARLYLPLVVRPAVPAPAGAPAIESFQLSAAAGPMAAEVELRWRVRGATSVRIEPGVGEVLGAASATVYPATTTAYTLTARNGRGSVMATATYTVNALPRPNPLAVAARPDAGRARGASIGRAGGLVEATGADGARYSLAIPPGALIHPEQITLTPAAAIDGVPFAATGVRAVSIAPEGLLFIEPATLTITPPAGPRGERAIGFAFQGAGAEFHLRTPLTPAPGLQAAGGPVQLAVTTARSYGAADISAGDDVLAPPGRRPPSDRGDAVEHARTTTPKVGFVMLVDLYWEWVRPLLEAAVADPRHIDSAARNYIAWRDAIAGRDIFRERISEANLLLGEALRKAGALAGERCAQGQPEQGFALQRYMGYAKRFGLTNTRAALEERLTKCWTFRLNFHSRIDERLDPVIAAYEVKATLPLTFRDGRLVGSGPLTWEEFSLDNGSECQIVTNPQGSTFDAASDGLGLWVAPVGRSSPDVSLRLSYDPGKPMGDYVVVCPEAEPVPAASPAWWVYYGEMHGQERQGEIYTALAPAVSFGRFPGWVYDNMLPANNIQEHTEITLEHTPVS